MTFTSKLRPTLSAKTGGIARTALAAALLSLSAHSSWATLTTAQLLKAVTKQLPSGKTIQTADISELDAAVLAAINKDKADAAAFVTAVLKARTNPDGDAVAFASGLAVTTPALKGQVAKGAIKASPVNAVAISTGVGGNLDPSLLPAFTATAISAVKTNGSLIADITAAIASGKEDAVKTAIVAKVVTATALSTQSSAATSIAKELEEQINDSPSQVAFAQTLALAVPAFAKQFALGAVFANPTLDGQIAASVALANSKTIAASSKIAGALAAALNIEAAGDIALALADEFQKGTPNALALAKQSPAIAKQLATSVIKRPPTYYTNGENSQDEIIAVVSLLAVKVPDATTSKVSILASMAAQVIGVNTKTKTYTAATFDQAVIGAIAKIITTEIGGDLTAFYSSFQSKLLALGLPAKIVKQTIADFKAGNVSGYKSGNLLPDETPVVNS